MSYARFGEGGSDVYVYHDIGGYILCCGCILQERVWVDDPDYSIFKGYMKSVGEKVQVRFNTVGELEAHLQRHTDAGHHVPDEIMTRVRKDFPDGIIPSEPE